MDDKYFLKAFCSILFWSQDLRPLSWFITPDLSLLISDVWAEPWLQGFETYLSSDDK